MSARYKPNTKKFQRLLIGESDKALRQTTAELAQNVETSMQQTKLERSVAPGTPTRKQPPSRPGFPPAPKTGRLRGSVTNLRLKVLKWAVGTNLFYGRLHELGIGKFPRRPFLAPQLRMRDALQRRVTRLISRGLARRALR